MLNLSSPKEKFNCEYWSERVLLTRNTNWDFQFQQNTNADNIAFRARMSAFSWCFCLSSEEGGAGGEIGTVKTADISLLHNSHTHISERLKGISIQQYTMKQTITPKREQKRTVTHHGEHTRTRRLYVICVILLNINMSFRDTFESDEPILHIWKPVGTHWIKMCEQVCLISTSIGEKSHLCLTYV